MQRRLGHLFDHESVNEFGAKVVLVEFIQPMILLDRQPGNPLAHFWYVKNSGHSTQRIYRPGSTSSRRKTSPPLHRWEERDVVARFQPVLATLVIEADGDEHRFAHGG